MPNSQEHPLKDFGSSILDRVGNPVTGTFLVSWMAVNWQVIVVTFFGTYPERDRIAAIKECFKDGFIWQGIALPLIVTALYLVAMPLLKEIYLGWLNRSEYRIRRQKRQMDEDLREEGEYRETLRALCAVLKKEIAESKTAIEKIHDLSASGLSSYNIAYFKQIADISHNRGRALENVTNHIEHFFGHYTGELPGSYQFFLAKWVKTLGANVLPGNPTQRLN